MGCSLSCPTYYVPWLSKGKAKKMNCRKQPLQTKEKSHPRQTHGNAAYHQRHPEQSQIHCKTAHIKANRKKMENHGSDKHSNQTPHNNLTPRSNPTASNLTNQNMGTKRTIRTPNPRTQTKTPRAQTTNHQRHQDMIMSLCPQLGQT